MSVTYTGPAVLHSLYFDNEIHWYDRVTSVSLDGSKFDDRVVDELCKFKHLGFVSLYKTNLTDEGVARLRSRLPGCQVQVDPTGASTSASSGQSTVVPLLARKQ
ncbi:MAG: hypothetical protein ABI614_21300 [Planctomycetota bacterium]